MENLKTAISNLNLSKEGFENGLKGSEIKKRQDKYGKNILRQTRKNKFIKLFLSQFKSFIVIVLFIASIISFIAGERINFYVINVVILVVISLGFYQEFRAEKALSALKNMINPKTKAIRKGELETVLVRDIVPGDVVFLEPGDKVPADAIVFENNELKLDESLLTGESLPVQKENDDKIFAGSKVVYGNCKALVVEIGHDTEIGKIADAVQEDDTKTPLQKKITKMSMILAFLGLFTSVLAAIFGIWSGADPIELSIISLTLAVATVPEGLPLTLTITLTNGTRLLAKENALVRKLIGVETLGSASVICTDKTGTITKNEMTVKKVFTMDQEYNIQGQGYDTNKVEIDMNENIEKLLTSIILNNNASFSQEDEDGYVGDPTEIALLVLGEKFGIDTDKFTNKYEREKELLFTSERKMMSTINRYENQLYLFSKGAPEIIVEKCSYDQKGNELSEESKKEIMEKNNEYTNSAYRVLAVACKEDVDEGTSKEELESDMKFLGLVAMIDPAREESAQAIEECQKAGIRVIMITGDNKDTARAIAKEVGILDQEIKNKREVDNDLSQVVSDGVITGPELENLNNKQLQSLIYNVSVFARINPNQKLKIVKALQANDEIVAMTGDGVNDAPAIKKADIGIAMGQTGTDVSKESAVMILEDDNFATIVEAVRKGRGIYENIEKFIVYLISQNFNEIVLILLGLVFLGYEYLPLTALQILFINTFDEILPSLSLGLDNYRADLMKEKPRDSKENLLNLRNVFLIISASAFMGISSFLVFSMSNPESDVEVARTITYLTISLMIVFRPIAFKSLKRFALFDIWKNKLIIISAIVSLIATIMFIYIPFLQNLIDLHPLTLQEWIVPAIIAVGSFFWIELSKVLINLYLKN